MSRLVYREYAPSAALAPTVRALFTFGAERAAAPDFHIMREAVFASPADVSRILMADLSPSVVIRSAGVWNVDGVGATLGATPSALLLGPMPHGLATAIDDHVEAVGAYIRIGVLPGLIRHSMHELLGRGLPLADLLGPAADRALERVATATDAAVRLQTLEALLLSLNSSRADALTRRFYAACSAAPSATVDAHAARLGVSRQHLARRLRATIGAPPKLVLRIARFRNVLKAVAARPCSWAGLAAGHGYYDQSHLIADFREFSSASPAALARANLFHPFSA